MPLTSSQIEECFALNDDCIKSIAGNILNLHLQSQNSERIVIGSVNKLLSVSKSRSQGLEYLNLIINNCSSGIINENALNWINHCLVKYPGDILKEIKLTTIGKIIEVAYKEQEFAKKFVSDYISKVLEICLHPHTNCHEKESALVTLTICMKRYASWFTSHKVKIESFLIQCMDDSSKSIVEKAAIAFHYLQQVGGAGLDGVNHKNNFSTSFQKLCATVHSLFDEFLENEMEFEQFNRSSIDGFKFTDTSVDSQKLLYVLSRRIRNCVIFLTTMMIKGFPVAKEIKPIEVLDIISRGTMIHHCLTLETEKSLPDFQFSLLLNNIQIQLLQLLRIFIIWFQTNSLPFSFIISKILTDCLKKSQNCSCFTSNCLYQEAVYKVLNQWIRVSKCSLQPHFQSQLVTCILKDITPLKTSLSLSISIDSDRNKSKKAKRKSVQEKIIASGLNSSSVNKTVAERLNQESNCALALDTLRHLLTASFLNIDTSLLKDLYSSVIGTLMEISTSKFPHPYTNPECQVRLYQVLGAFYEQDTLQILPPLQVALDILTKGSNRNNRLIAVSCEHSLSNLEKLCQPVCPSLYSPEISTRQSEANEETIFDEQIINEIAPGSPRVADSSEATVELWCATEIAGDEVEDKEQMEVEASTKITIQDVKIIKTSTSMEVSSFQTEEMTQDVEITANEVRNDADESEQQPRIDESEQQPRIDESEQQPRIDESEQQPRLDESEQQTRIDESEQQPRIVESTDVEQAGIEIEMNILKKEVTNNDMQLNETDDAIRTKTLEANAELKNEVLSSDNLDQEVQVSSSEPVNAGEQPQENENVVCDPETTNKNATALEAECGEPPLKKIRVEGCSENDAVKQEMHSCEDIDDVFDEEDSFVDVVKEDY